MNTTMLEDALSVVRKAFPGAMPDCGLVLGSGLAELARNFSIKGELQGKDLGTAAGPAVPGHSGRILLGTRAGIETLVFCGRHHWYEGIGWEPIALPVYLLKKLGASTIVLTNAAGGIRPDLVPGDIMVIDDHINAMGVNPLIGNTDPVWGPRFADQSCIYDKRLRDLLDAAATRSGTRIKHGIYLATSGPTYETPAETRVFRNMGADAVAMSTVPEAMLANAAGLRIAGISSISNMAAGLKTGTQSHEEVLQTVQRSIPALTALLAAFWDGLPGTLGHKDQGT